MAAIISSMLVVAAPAAHAFAAESTTGETAQPAKAEEPKEEKPEKEDPPSSEGHSESGNNTESSGSANTGGKDTSGDGENSGSGNSSSEKEDSGSGDTGGKEDSGSGDTGIKDDDSAEKEKPSAEKEESQGSSTKDTSSKGDSSAESSDTPSEKPAKEEKPSNDSGSDKTSGSGSTTAPADSGQTAGSSAKPAAPAKTADPAAQREKAANGVMAGSTQETAAEANTAEANTAEAKDKSKDIKDKKTELDPDETPTGYEQAAGHTGTNEQLIASQNIVSGLSILHGDDFRFHTVEKDLAISAKTQDIHEEKKSSSRKVGVLRENDMLYILSEEKDGWFYIESGDARGFVKKNNILMDKSANAALTDLQAKLDRIGKLTGKSPLRAEGLLHTAQETVPADENAAYAYKRYTTKETVIDKEYAVSDKETYIMEKTSSSSRKVGRLGEGNLAYVISPVDEKWLFVESGNVRGFVKRSSLTTGAKAKNIVKKKGESNMATAEQYIEPKENNALYYSLCSVKDGTVYSTVRTEIVQIASECIGNPYVWGGESLTYGADCSGFVQTLYSMFGYKIPRVADAQSQYGTQIPVSDAAPGDLIFFAANGYVYHVALYAGDGMTIEAYSEDRGIIATEIGNRDAVWATRVIKD